MKNEHSLMEAAVLLLQTEKKPYDLYQLFDIITKGKSFSEAEKNRVITKFYADLTTSARFVYTGDNQWDLKANQKIELWEKDGSFYKEYTKVDLPDELKPPKKEKKPRKTKAKKAKAKPVVEPVIIIKEADKVVEPVVEVVVEAVVEPVSKKAPKKTTDKDAVVEHYEEEVFEEFDEFDEEKYNEYMDTYEDQYDNKKNK